jgi:hypothetical protein
MEVCDHGSLGNSLRDSYSSDIECALIENPASVTASACGPSDAMAQFWKPRFHDRPAERRGMWPVRFFSVYGRFNSDCRVDASCCSNFAMPGGVYSNWMYRMACRSNGTSLFC